MDYVVPRNESWWGRYSQGTCELGTPWLTTWGNSSQHQGGVLVLDKLWNTKPLVVPIKTKGHGSWEEMDFGYPQRILIMENKVFVKLYLWIDLWNGGMTCLLEYVWIIWLSCVYDFDLRLLFVISSLEHIIFHLLAHAKPYHLTEYLVYSSFRCLTFLQEVGCSLCLVIWCSLL